VIWARRSFAYIDIGVEILSMTNVPVAHILSLFPIMAPWRTMGESFGLWVSRSPALTTDTADGNIIGNMSGSKENIEDIIYDELFMYEAGLRQIEGPSICFRGERDFKQRMVVVMLTS
jgi:hypothetical protein